MQSTPTTTTTTTDVPFVRMEDEGTIVSTSAEPSTALVEHHEGAGISMVPLDSISKDETKGSNLGIIGTREGGMEGFNDLKVHQGHADFDLELQQVSNSKWNFGKTKRSVIKVIYLSIFAILGALVRVMMAQLFGEDCENAGTIGWLKAGQPLCVTADGDTSLEGGIIFADLPANLLGSFIMGLMQTTDTMDLPKTFPIAWLGEKHPFQSFDVIHIAITVGFCGSLTTFSSWNSEMILMMLGADGDRGSLIFRGLLGYFIGLETALASFILGKNVAKYLHSSVNRALQHEAMEIKKKRECGWYINTQLSDFERRFLSELEMGEFEIYINPIASGFLSRWRESTRDHRRVGNRMLPLLTDIEYQALVIDEDPEQDMVVSAMMAKWDLDALNKWRESKREMDIRAEVFEPNDFSFKNAFGILFLLLASITVGLCFLTNEDESTIIYRMMLYSLLFAPIGALLRHKMSHWNGKWTRHSWFPLGTFSANFVGCIISALGIGLEYRLNGLDGFWTIGTLRAIRVGLAGSLSTVSTFICEFATQLSSENPIKGYTYAFVSIITCGLVCAISYFSVTYNMETVLYYHNANGYGY